MGTSIEAVTAVKSTPHLFLNQEPGEKQFKSDMRTNPI